jgi:hypothetical protein
MRSKRADACFGVIHTSELTLSGSMVVSVNNDVLTIPSIKERMSGIRKNGRAPALFANIASPANFFTSPRSQLDVGSGRVCIQRSQFAGVQGRELREARCKPDHVE